MCEFHRDNKNYLLLKKLKTYNIKFNFKFNNLISEIFKTDQKNKIIKKIKNTIKKNLLYLYKFFILEKLNNNKNKNKKYK